MDIPTTPQVLKPLSWDASSSAFSCLRARNVQGDVRIPTGNGKSCSPGCTAGTENQHTARSNRDVFLLQCEEDPVDIGVVAAEQPAPVDHGIDSTDGPGCGVHLIQKGNDGGLVGDGHGEPTHTQSPNTDYRLFDIRYIKGRIHQIQSGF